MDPIFAILVGGKKRRKCELVASGKIFRKWSKPEIGLYFLLFLFSVFCITIVKEIQESPPHMTISIFRHFLELFNPFKNRVVSCTREKPVDSF